MNVLVTGALGALGSAVVRRLVEESIDVTAFDQHDNTELIDEVAPQVRVEVGDIRDWSRLLWIMRRHSITDVIHMAVVLPDQAQRDPKLAHEVNVGGTVGVCELARSLGLRRVVFASSKGVYRQMNDEHGHPAYKPVREEYAIGPDGVYDATKYAAEQLGLNYASSHGVDFIALRFAATYGPGRMARHGALAIRSAIVENAFFGRPTVVERGGEQLDDFVYSKDVAQGLVKAVLADNVRDRVFNIGTGQPSSLVAAAEVIKREIPKAEIRIGPGTDYGASGRYCIFDITRAREQLGYEPEFSLADGIRDYLSTLAMRSTST